MDDAICKNAVCQEIRQEMVRFGICLADTQDQLRQVSQTVAAHERKSMRAEALTGCLRAENVHLKKELAQKEGLLVNQQVELERLRGELGEGAARAPLSDVTNSPAHRHGPAPAVVALAIPSAWCRRHRRETTRQRAQREPMKTCLSVKKRRLRQRSAC